MIDTKLLKHRHPLQFLLLVFFILSQSFTLNAQSKVDLSHNKIIVVDGGNLSGYRQNLVKVDIGFGNRLYWAYTNDYGQLVQVTANRITPQNDDTEPVTSKGRYYYDEAKVPGVESKYLDEGHVIADSLGGVSNAYNITPQESQLNRHGQQAKMEELIRSSNGCTNFTAIISYPNTQTQIPNHYSFTFTINAKKYTLEFDNTTASTTSTSNASTTNSLNVENPTVDQTIQIIQLDKVNEYIILKNVSESAVNLKGWTIVSVRGNQRYTFGTYLLQPNQQVKIGDSKKTPVDLYWLEGSGVWNNSKSDPAQVYDNNNKLISVMQD